MLRPEKLRASSWAPSTSDPRPPHPPRLLAKSNMAGKCEDLNTVKPHPEEEIGEPCGAWSVLGAALEAGNSNYYCKFSPELRMAPKNACKIGAKKSRFHGVLCETTHEIRLRASMYPFHR